MHNAAGVMAIRVGWRSQISASRECETSDRVVSVRTVAQAEAEETSDIVGGWASCGKPSVMYFSTRTKLYEGPNSSEITENPLEGRSQED